MPPKAKSSVPKSASSLAKAGSSILSPTPPKAKAKSAIGDRFSSGSTDTSSHGCVGKNCSQPVRNEAKANVVPELRSSLGEERERVLVERLDHMLETLSDQGEDDSEDISKASALPKAKANAVVEIETTPTNTDNVVLTEQLDSLFATLGDQGNDKSEANIEVSKDSENEDRDRLAALANGEVVVKYNMYAEKFSICAHKLEARVIDDLYCLSDIMPKCCIRLSDHEFSYDEERVYMKEDPIGTFIGLCANETYWCYVEQDVDVQRQDQEKCRKAWEGGVISGIGDRDLGKARCTCCEGVPCSTAQKHICLDWENRLAVAERARRPFAAGLAS